MIGNIRVMIMIKAVVYPYFDVTMLSYEQGVCKSDPEIFRRMIRSLKVKPEECLYVGDGGSHELYAASDMGMKAYRPWYFTRWHTNRMCPMGCLMSSRTYISRKNCLTL